MMNDFESVLNALKETIPELTIPKSMWYSIKGYHTCLIEVSVPNSFDSYLDIIARITLYHKGKIISETLITKDTDVKKFCNKLYNKIITLEK